MPSLSAACDVFVRSTSREDLAENATSLLEVTQSHIRQGNVPNDAASRLLSAITRCRRASLDQGLTSVRNWAACDTLSLVETGPWDSLQWLLYLCQCHLRTCLARLFSDAGAWDPEWEDPTFEYDDDFVAMKMDEAETCRRELEAGVEPDCISSYLRDEDRSRRVSEALTVCLRGVVEPEKQCEKYFMEGQPTKMALRFLERHALCLDAAREFAKCLDTFDLEPDREALMTHAAHVTAWGHKTIAVDANNTLLLRMDEWAVANALQHGDLCVATGEKGTVPQEHRNTPAAWVAQKALPDDQYQSLMKTSKNNVNNPLNLYVAFSGTLEQHYNFDWLKRCFVLHIDPLRAFRKTMEFLNAARDITPSFVVQKPDGGATILARVIESGGGAVFRRVECETPQEVISAWMALVERHNGGTYTRKARVSDLIQRVRSASETRDAEEETRLECVPIDENDTEDN